VHKTRAIIDDPEPESGSEGDGCGTRRAVHRAGGGERETDALDAPIRRIRKASV
jgi:hypothetical protein